jgi:hypothetical protein
MPGFYGQLPLSKLDEGFSPSESSKAGMPSVDLSGVIDSLLGGEWSCVDEGR